MMMPATPILMFTTFTDTHLKEVALAAGVHAVIDKNEGGTTLIDNIRTLLTGCRLRLQHSCDGTFVSHEVSPERVP
jgi:DNA-binding NarL/FixJ family response regulator